MIGADVMSSIIDYTDRATCVLFGDGAGAVVLGPSDDPNIGILDFEHKIDGNGGPALCMPAGGSKLPASHETVDERLHYVKQDGQTVFKFAVRNTGEICERLLKRNNLTGEDLELFVSHQANKRIIMSAAERIGMPEEKVIINIDTLRQHDRGDDPARAQHRGRDRPLEEGRSGPADLGRRRLHGRLGPGSLGNLEPASLGSQSVSNWHVRGCQDHLRPLLSDSPA